MTFNKEDNGKSYLNAIDKVTCIFFKLITLPIDKIKIDFLCCDFKRIINVKIKRLVLSDFEKIDMETMTK